MKIFTVLISITLIALSQNIFSQETENNQINPLSNRFALSLEGGATYPQTDFPDDKISYIGQLSLDYYFQSHSIGAFGLRVFGYYGQLNGSGVYRNMSSFPTIPEYFTDIAALGAGVTYTLNVSEVFYPYVFLGADYMYFNPKYKDGNKLPRNEEGWYANNEWSAVGEVGSKFFLSNSISLNIALNYNYLPSDNLDDVDNSISNGTQDDIFISTRAGISFYFGGIQDSDNDGVRDEDDMCPDTPPGVTIDMFGCPIDSDRDNVPDYADDCPNTPLNIPVDVNGCPLDSDNDGIPDYLDLCNDTPNDVLVDANGCPEDSDADGIPDFKDLCPNTPAGTEVDKLGCPKEEIVSEKVQKIQFDFCCGVFFEIGKAELLPAAYPELEKVLKVMRDYPETKWKIEGHTDNKGNYNKNIELSKQRAQSVYNYFASKGIDKSRLFINGFGSDFPVADNNTETGRTLNRRVTIVLVSDKFEEKNKVPETRRYNPAVERNVGKMVFTDGYLYCFQISAFRTITKAEHEAQVLKSRGYDSFVVIANLPELGGTWYRVRVGYFNSLDEVIKKRSSLIKD